MGNFTVLDVARLPVGERKRFDELPRHPALPTNADLRFPLLEPHPSWMTRIAAEWERRYTKLRRCRERGGPRFASFPR